jgi:hypothetical protein
MLVTERIRKFVVNLYECGYRGLSDEPKGCTTFDEEYLASMLIQETPRPMLPDANAIDREGKLLDLIAAYMSQVSVENRDILMQYLVDNTIEYYKFDLKHIFNTITQSSKRIAS